MCKIFKNQVIVRKLAVIAINNETMAEMIDSPSLAPLLFLVLVCFFPLENFISHNPICVLLSLLFSVASLALLRSIDRFEFVRFSSVCAESKATQKIFFKIQVSGTQC